MDNPTEIKIIMLLTGVMSITVLGITIYIMIDQALDKQNIPLGLLVTSVLFATFTVLVQTSGLKILRIMKKLDEDSKQLDRY